MYAWWFPRFCSLQVNRDFSKTFAKFDHNLLISKLSCVGVGFMVSKLSVWSLSEGVLHFLSLSRYWYLIWCPQGRHLGPILVAVFVNDLLASILYSRVVIFADHVRIYFSFDTITYMLYHQLNLRNLFIWLVINGRFLNLAKQKHYRETRLTTTSHLVSHVATFQNKVFYRKWSKRQSDLNHFQ